MAGEIQLNSVSLATESSGTVTLNSSTDIKGCLNASGSAPIYACRAWINFDGTSASIGTGRASANVSGVTDNGTADYTINFATAMPDANYAITGTHNRDITGNYGYAFAAPYNQAPTTTTVRVRPEPAAADAQYVSVAIFR